MNTVRALGPCEFKPLSEYTAADLAGPVPMARQIGARLAALGPQDQPFIDKYVQELQGHAANQEVIDGNVKELRERLADLGSEEWVQDVIADYVQEIQQMVTESPTAELHVVRDDWLNPELAAPSSRNRVLSAAEFVGQLGPREWLVEDVINADAEVVAIPGASKAGKSFVAMSLGMAVHRGTPWFGRETRKSRVVYVVAEGAGDFRYRMSAYSQEHGIPLAEMFSVVGNAPNMLNIKNVEDLITQIKAAGGADVVIFDTLSATTPGANQNDTAPMTNYIEALKAIHRTTGAQCWYLHHAGKDEGKGQRGSSALIGAADVELWVSRDGDLRTVELTKSKATPEAHVLTFTLRYVRLGVDRRNKEYGSCVIDEVKDAPKRGTVVRGKFEKAIMQAARQAGGSEIHTDDLREAVFGRIKHVGDGKDQRNTSFKRALNNLVNNDPPSLFVVDGKPGFVKLTSAVETDVFE